MREDEMTAQHLVELGLLEEHLRSQDFETKLLPQSKDLPLSVLLVSVPTDAENQGPLQLQLAFLPLADDDLEMAKFLQIYTTLPIQVQDGQETLVQSFLHEINHSVLLGYFGLAAGGELFYRHVNTLKNFEVTDKDLFDGMLAGYFMTLEIFMPAIQGLAVGAIDIDEARRQVGD